MNFSHDKKSVVFETTDNGVVFKFNRKTNYIKTIDPIITKNCN